MFLNHIFDRFMPVNEGFNLREVGYSYQFTYFSLEYVVVACRHVSTCSSLCNTWGPVVIEARTGKLLNYQ